MNTPFVFFKSCFTLLCMICFIAPSFAEPANLALLQKEVQTYHDSGDYDKELNGIIKQARQYIHTRAQENKLSAHPKKLAVVLDIDETSLTNYNKMAARQFVATPKQLQQDILAADSPAIHCMLALYQDALKQGVNVFFVTGRKESQRTATVKNLRLAGYDQWAGLYLKPDGYQQSSIIPFKSQARAAIKRQGYTVIATIGDQLSDIRGGFAEKGFKLPNPFYYLP